MYARIKLATVVILKIRLNSRRKEEKLLLNKQKYRKMHKLIQRAYIYLSCLNILKLRKQIQTTFIGIRSTFYVLNVTGIFLRL